MISPSSAGAKRAGSHPEAARSASKYAVLDGMRGLAALFVVVRHTPDLWDFSFFRSYLAVDLFFVLSGFVIAHAYDRKLSAGELTPARFMTARLIRLYPAYFFSLAFCILVIALEVSRHAASQEAGIGDYVVATLLSMLFLPSQIPGNFSLFPLNFPCWSLFFELVFNALYSATQKWLTRRVLLAIVVATGAFTVYCAMKNGGLDIGFLWGLRSVVTGGSRCFFGIFMGLLVYRHAHLFRVRSRLWCRYLPMAAVCLVLASPSVPRFDWVCDALCITVVFPACVALGGQRSTGRSDAVLLLLGAASYPVYVLHKPLGDLVKLGFDTAAIKSAAPWAGLLFVVLLTATAIVLERIYDLPVRRFLTGKLRPALAPS